MGGLLLTLRLLFQGRLNRRNFIIASIVLGLPFDLIFGYGVPTDTVIRVLFWLLIFPLILANASLVTRRLHDTGRSGWFFFCLLLPIVNIILGFYLLFKKGEPETNQYGPSPRPRIDLKDIIPFTTTSSSPKPA